MCYPEDLFKTEFTLPPINMAWVAFVEHFPQRQKDAQTLTGHGIFTEADHILGHNVTLSKDLKTLT